MSDLARYVAASRRRLELARSIADELRHDEELHRAAMTAVFVLEDCYEALARAQTNRLQSDPPGLPPSHAGGRARRSGAGGPVADPS